MGTWLVVPEVSLWKRGWWCLRCRCVQRLEDASSAWKDPTANFWSREDHCKFSQAFQLVVRFIGSELQAFASHCTRLFGSFNFQVISELAISSPP